TLVAERLGGIALGLSLRDRDPGLLAQALEMLTTDPAIFSAVSAHGAGVVLIDSVPDHDPRGRFGAALVAFIMKVATTGRRVISTGHRRLADDLGAWLAVPSTQEPIPPFSREEVE